MPVEPAAVPGVWALAEQHQRRGVGDVERIALRDAARSTGSDPIQVEHRG